MGEDFTAKLVSLPAVGSKTERIFEGEHRVRNGDTLSGIAARYRTTVAELQRQPPAFAQRFARGRRAAGPRANTVRLLPARRPCRHQCRQPPPGEIRRNAGIDRPVLWRFGWSAAAGERDEDHLPAAGSWLQIPSQQTAAGNSSKGLSQNNRPTLLWPQTAGKARATSIPGEVSKERATQPRACGPQPKGRAAGGHLLRCAPRRCHHIACVAAPCICPPQERCRRDVLAQSGPVIL